MKNKPGGMTCSNMIGPALVIMLGLVLGQAHASAATTWKRVARENGITVTSREVPGRGFPTFRGVGVVHASIFHILGVLSDISQYTKWVDRLIVSKRIKKINERQYVVYSRTDAPWPVSDRDAVFNSDVVVDLVKKQVTIKFWAVKSKQMKQVSGVVRMNKLRGHYKLTALSEKQTRVEYQVDADPGGILPKWIAKIATKRLPLYTIRNLRAQAFKTRGKYQERIKRWQSGKY